jgi:predicted exporter
MPSWAKKPSKPLALGMVGGVVGGVMLHVIDPPSIAILGVEALIAVAVLLLAIPHSPQTPNLNLIPIIH